MGRVQMTMASLSIILLSLAVYIALVPRIFPFKLAYEGDGTPFHGGIDRPYGWGFQDNRERVPYHHLATSMTTMTVLSPRDDP